MCTVLNTNTYMYIKILKIAIHVNRHVMTLRVLTRFFHSPQYIKVIHYITKPQWFIDKHLCCFTRSHYHLLTDKLSYLTGWQQHHGGFLQYSSGRSHLCPVFITLQILQAKVNTKCTEEVYKCEHIYIKCQWGKGSSEPKCLLSKIVYLVPLMFF